MNERKGIIEGRWLEKAIEAQGHSILKASSLLGYKRGDKFYYHIHNRSYLKAESLAELARLYPTMNIRYVLTGEGSPLLP